MSENFETDFAEQANEAAIETAAEAREEERQAEVAPAAVFVDEQAAPAVPAVVEAEDETDEEDEEDEEDEGPSEEDFFAENAAPAVPEVDPATILTLRTTGNRDIYVEVPVNETIPLVDAIAKSGLRFNGDFTCWLNGQEVGLGTRVGGTMTVSIIGSVKGGAL